MNRRTVLRSFLHLGSRGYSPPLSLAMVTAGIEQHTDPLTREDVYHLLRRVGFAPTLAQAESMIGKTAAEVVDQLLGSMDEAEAPSPGTWLDAWTEDPEGADLQTRATIYATWRSNMTKLADWWVNLMTTDTKAIEKTALFWTSHWTTEFSFDNTNSVPQMLYRQYIALRKNRLGDLRTMALCLAGEGVAYLTNFMVSKEIEAGELFEIPVDHIHEFHLWLARPKGKQLSLTSRTFLQHFIPDIEF